MKFLTITSTAAVLSAAVAFAAEQKPTVSVADAMKSVQDIDKPAGIIFVGTAEPLKEPPASDATQMGMLKDKSGKQEWFGSRGIGPWGWGGLGWGGFMPYRWGFNFGGLGGWAYPLGYWNAFGAGLYGGGCGLGLAYGGLFYC